jgi:pimeloyl-[acyl-carrier protein] synthase
LLSVLVNAQGSQSITEVEVFAEAMILLFAGHLTTTYQISNGMHLLLKNRDQWDLLVRRPDLNVPAVEEILRYESSTRITPRFALHDVDVRGHRIRKGERVYIVLSAANRDPSMFDDPDKFDIQRAPNRHITFGHGIHLCIGNALARMEVQEALKAVASRLPDIEMSGPTVWSPTPVMRYLQNMPVRWNTAAH